MLFRNSTVPTESESEGVWEGLRQLFRPDGEGSMAGAKALKEATVYTCIKILAETIGKLPLKIYRDEGGNRRAAEHYLYPLLKLRPNPYMSAFSFWSCMETQLNIYGNAYALLDISRRDGKIKGIYPLNAPQMRIYVDDAGLLSSSQRMWYCYTDKLGGERWINPDELFHFKGMSTDGITGMSVIEALRATIENSRASSRFLNNSYKKGLQASGILQYTGDLDEVGQNRMRERFEKMASGIVNANRIAVMPLGMKFEPMQLKLTDAQFLENTRFTVQQLTAAFGVKLHQVNDLTKSSYASVSESNREFYTDTLLSKLTMYEQEVTYKGFLNSEVDQKLYVKFNADVILRGDVEKLYVAYSQAVQNGFKTPNECRAMEEDSPMPGGDTLYGNGSLTPLTILERGSEKI